MNTKKLLAIILSLIVLTAGLVSCKENDNNTSDTDKTSEEQSAASSEEQSAAFKDEEAEQLLILASEKLESLNNYTLNATNDIAYGTTGQMVEMEQSIVIKVAFQDESNPMFSTETTFDIGFGEMTVSGIYASGYYYTDIVGEKMKAAVTSEQLSELAALYLSMSEDLKTEGFDSITKTDNNDGSRTVTCSEVKAESFNELYGDMLEGFDVYEDSDIDIEDMTLTTVIDEDGNIVSQNRSMSMKITTDEEQISYSLQTTITYSDLGTTTINAPESTDDYEEMEYSDLLAFLG